MQKFGWFMLEDDGDDRMVIGVDDGVKEKETGQARWPGSLLLAVLRSSASDKWEGYKKRLPARKDAKPKIDKPSVWRQRVSRWHGHATLYVLAGTLMNVMGKVFMNLRYEDIQRLHFEKYQSRENSEHWKKLVLVTENEVRFWEKFLKDVNNLRSARSKLLQECREASECNNELAPSSVASPRWGTMERQLKHGTTDLHKRCGVYDEWIKFWSQLHEVAQAEVVKHETTRRNGFALSVSHAAAALFWEHASSRDLVFRIQIPWTGIVIKLWRGRWSGLD